MALPLLAAFRGLAGLKALKVLGPIVGPEAVKLAKKIFGAKTLRDAAHDLAWQRNGLVGEVRFTDGGKRWVVVTAEHVPIAAFPPFKEGTEAQLREGLDGVDFSRCVGPSKQQQKEDKRRESDVGHDDAGPKKGRSERSSRRPSLPSSSASRKR